jgi:DNA-binding beta-propeller fold protein YncE
MNIKNFLIYILLTVCNLGYAQNVVNINIGNGSTPETSDVAINLKHRFQHYNQSLNSNGNTYDNSINSPKSVNILTNKNKFYIHSLEGYTTSVYSSENFTKIKDIKHEFGKENQYLFDKDDLVNYTFRTKKSDLNYFKGKPVEGCFSHEGKYLWVTYYRRSYDSNAIDPSAVCIIDTDTDSIIKVLSTGTLPKMISCSPDNNTIAITHWGDNTVILVDISSDNPSDFKHRASVVIDYKPKLNFDIDEEVNRDQNCHNCLRGTVFTPDNKYILIGKMGKSSIAVINSSSGKYIGSVSGMRNNMRHLIIKNDHFYLSINRGGYIQKTNIDSFVTHLENDLSKDYNNWEEVFVGYGARTIEVDPTGRYLFVAVSNESEIVIVKTEDMKIIATCPVDSFPVGLDVSADGKYVIVTSQGKAGKGGGNSVMIFEIKYKK